MRTDVTIQSNMCLSQGLDTYSPECDTDLALAHDEQMLLNMTSVEQTGK